MRSWIRVGLVGAAAVAACTFNPSHAQQTGDGSSAIDASIDAPPVAPDAGPCMGSSIECADVDTLRVCTTVGGQAMDTICSWGCGTNGGVAHCQQLAPTGGAATGSDTVGSDVGAATLPNGAMIHLDNGQIDPGIRGSGSGVMNNIYFEVRGGVAVFRFGDLTMMGSVSFMGPQPQPPVVLVSTGSIVLDGPIDAQGGCTAGNGGPGGFPATNNGQTPAGSGAGGGATASTLGAGGGGYGSAGGSGGNASSGASAATPAGGTAFGSDDIPVLVGGGAGGGGAGGNPFGGGGGGAIQLVANGTITIDRGGTLGSINAGGCGGTSGMMNNATDTGGGGGAGGTILLEAHDISIKGSLAVNGGGGGSTHANGTPANLNGANGALGRQAALGSTAGPPAGGNGGWGGSLVGAAGGISGSLAAAGGGSVGRIRFNTRAGSASIDGAAVLSPALTDTPSTCTQGVAATQ